MLFVFKTHTKVWKHEQTFTQGDKVRRLMWPKQEQALKSKFCVELSCRFKGKQIPKSPAKVSWLLIVEQLKW